MDRVLRGITPVGEPEFGICDFCGCVSHTTLLQFNEDGNKIGCQSCQVHIYGTMKEMKNRPFYKKVLEFATEAHLGQFRKPPDREPYIEHPIRVSNGAVEHWMNKFPAVATPGSLIIIAAIGLLHDIVEDTGVTIDELRKFLYSIDDDTVSQLQKDQIVGSVKLLTRMNKSELVVPYVLGIKEDSFARVVKLEDLNDNTKDLSDGNLLDKYQLIKYILTS